MVQTSSISIPFSCLEACDTHFSTTLLEPNKPKKPLTMRAKILFRPRGSQSQAMIVTEWTAQSLFNWTAGSAHDLCFGGAKLTVTNFPVQPHIPSTHYAPTQPGKLVLTQHQHLAPQFQRHQGFVLHLPMLQDMLYHVVAVLVLHQALRVLKQLVENWPRLLTRAVLKYPLDDATAIRVCWKREHLKTSQHSSFKAWVCFLGQSESANQQLSTPGKVTLNENLPYPNFKRQFVCVASENKGNPLHPQPRLHGLLNWLCKQCSGLVPGY